jgi:hypothetical protein
MFEPNRVLRDKDAGAGAGAGAGGGGGATPPWYGDDAHKGLVETKGFKGVGDVITWGTNLEKLIGADKAGRTVVLPKDANDADGIKAFRAKIGVPEKVDGYKSPGDKFKVDDPMWAPVTAAALKHGISVDAFGGFIPDVLAAMDAIIEKQNSEAKKASDAALTALKGEWGDKFDANAEIGRRYVKALGLEDSDLAAIEGALGTSKFLKVFHAGGVKLGEAGGAGGGAEGGSGGVTKEQAQAKLDEARLARLDNKLTDVAYMAIVDKYGPIAHPTPKAA